MRMNLKRGLAGVAAIASIATVAPFIGGAGIAAAAGTNLGTATLAPTTGNAATGFNLTLPAAPNNKCTGDNIAGYNVQTFMVPATTDLSLLTFNANGPTFPATGFKAPLFSAGAPFTDQAPNSGSAVVSLPQFDFSVLPLTGASAVTSGAYKIGAACTQGGTRTLDNYWSKTITVTNTGSALTWSAGAAAAAPTVTAPTTGGPSLNGNGQITVAYTPGTSDPAVGATGFTATATNGANTFTGTSTTAGGPITITGLTNGLTYSVTVAANNGVGSPAVSAPVNFNPSLPVAPAVTGLVAVSNPGNVTASWNAYTGTPAGATFSGYSVAVTKGVGAAAVPVAGSPFTQATTSFVQASAPGDTFNFVVTPLFSAPAGQLGTASSIVTGSVLASQTLNQVITTTRPVGALVLTQVCGRYGSLGAEAAQLGFPTGIPATTTAPNDGDNPDPTLGGAPALSQANIGITGDPKFTGYPYPADPTTGVANPNYPTWCGVDLGAAQFVATGAAQYGRGQFFSAQGRLNQVTVVDTRDGDVGFNIAASVSDFTSGSNTFSGNQLGWTPKVNRDTALFTDALGNTYDQTTTAGPAVAQNTLVSSGTGLHAFNANTLIKALPKSTTGIASTGGLGIAVADARLKVAIPVTAIAGTYTAVLTISSF